MPTIRDLIRPGMEWPPPGHADRIEAQEIHALIARNRRHELVQEFSLDLIRGGINDQEEVVPFPAAKIAARTLASFLFGEDPTYTHDDDDVEAAVRTFAAETNLAATLLEAAYTQAVEGEVYLRPSWDLEVDDRHALISGIAGHRVIPRFRYGRLLDAAVVSTFLEGRGRGAGVTYWRLVEEYVPGGITRRLFAGRADRLGSEVSLESRPETDGLDKEVDTGLDRPTIVHVPLGRWDADSPHGVSLFDGLESLILGMHRLYSQEQHDAEMARRRIAVSEEYLTRDAAGNPRLDRRTDLLVLGEEAAGAVGGERSAPVIPIEFDDDLAMRDRIAGRFREFLIACGIAPDSLDANEAGGAISGTSRRLAQALTLQTVGSIGRHWQQAIPEVLEQALEIERIHLGAALPEAEGGLRPTVTLADGLITDEAELAKILVDLDSAEAVSTETKIRRLHPEWSDDEVASEMDRIRGNLPPDPIPSFGGNGRTPFGVSR